MMTGKRSAKAGVVAPPGGGLGSWLKGVYAGAWSLLSGMRLTLGYFADPRKVVTQQYPENRATLVMFPRFRGPLALLRDEAGLPLCVACGICQQTCPNATISVLTTRNAAGKKILGRYLYRLGQCTFCGLCVESCPYGAIRQGQEFELAADNRQVFMRTLYDWEETS